MDQWISGQYLEPAEVPKRRGQQEISDFLTVKPQCAVFSKTSDRFVAVRKKEGNKLIIQGIFGEVYFSIVKLQFFGDMEKIQLEVNLLEAGWNAEKDATAKSALKKKLDDADSRLWFVQTDQIDLYGEYMITKILTKDYFPSDLQPWNFPVMQFLGAETCSLNSMELVQGNPIYDYLEVAYKDSINVAANPNATLIAVSSGQIDVKTMIENAVDISPLEPMQMIVLILLQTFGILHQLQVAAKFCHFDLHDENVMIDIAPESAENIKFSLDNTRKVAIRTPKTMAPQYNVLGDTNGVRIVAKLIDFGLSFIDAGPEKRFAMTRGYTAKRNSGPELNSFRFFYPSFDVYRICITELMTLLAKHDFINELRKSDADRTPGGAVKLDPIGAGDLAAIFLKVFEQRKSQFIGFTNKDANIKTPIFHKKRNRVLPWIDAVHMDITAKQLEGMWNYIISSLKYATTKTFKPITILYKKTPKTITPEFNSEVLADILDLIKFGFATPETKINSGDVIPLDLLTMSELNPRYIKSDTDLSSNPSFDAKSGPADKSAADINKIYNR